MKLLWTKESLIKLQEIEEYISSDNPQAAIEFIDKLISLLNLYQKIRKKEGSFQNFL